MKHARLYRPNYRIRRLVASLLLAAVATSGAIVAKWQESPPAIDLMERPLQVRTVQPETGAMHYLAQLEVKGRAPKTAYRRTQFGPGWQRFANGCDTRNEILRRDLRDAAVDERCKVQRGILHDPYTGKVIEFLRGPTSSEKVQIDHVVALSNAWQTGAQLLSPERRNEFANDPLNLLAVDGAANQEKGDSDAATWLPSHKPYRCAYVARQIAIKYKYSLWVTPSENMAMQRVLSSCPAQPLPAK